ncbi:hypothetical protein GIB67_035096 [Kingdonia uniflora]|uniref:Uncharacterized protein n=1 Tax=Kingdonia uniflora TaxID=39325 RepID=A0A7J7MC98_9MAGN|nr:hypothetical protein GIB67_035096 [Kingdonia uniflora]
MYLFCVAEGRNVHAYLASVVNVNRRAAPAVCCHPALVLRGHPALVVRGHLALVVNVAAIAVNGLLAPVPNACDHSAVIVDHYPTHALNVSGRPATVVHGHLAPVVTAAGRPINVSSAVAVVVLDLPNLWEKEEEALLGTEQLPRDKMKHQTSPSLVI